MRKNIFTFGILLSVLVTLNDFYSKNKIALKKSSEFAQMNKQAFWKKDKYFVPKNLVSKGEIQFLNGDLFEVIQVVKDFKCSLGIFEFVFQNESFFVLKGVKNRSTSKLEKHFFVTDEKVFFEFDFRRENHSESSISPCREWMAHASR